MNSGNVSLTVFHVDRSDAESHAVMTVLWLGTSGYGLPERPAIFLCRVKAQLNWGRSTLFSHVTPGSQHLKGPGHLTTNGSCSNRSEGPSLAICIRIKCFDLTMHADGWERHSLLLGLHCPVTAPGICPLPQNPMLAFLPGALPSCPQRFIVHWSGNHRLYFT